MHHKYCNRYTDDAPGVRGMCEWHLKSGRMCEECPNRKVHVEVKDLREALKWIRTQQPGPNPVWDKCNEVLDGEWING